MKRAAAIEVTNLSKRYSLGVAPMHRSIRDRIASLFESKHRRGAAEAGEFWALRNVSFDVAHGEILGVIGRNGAGKSTLLKILSRITTPTDGAVRLYGRVGSLLEVGTGFHPELSGRENIFLNGSILGLRRAEIEQKFDEIVAFSEVERFIDTPVKRYSSGMYVRLAFAVAAHLEPEILIVDEVLAVGDAAFQKRCLGKMSEVAHAGRTVLFVSHNMVAVQSLCTRALYLKDGSVMMDGGAHEVVAKYLSSASVGRTEQQWDDLSTAPGNSKVRMHAARVVAAGTDSAEHLTVRTPIALEFEFWTIVPGIAVNLSIIVQNEEGLALFNTVPIFEPQWHGRKFPAGLFKSTCIIPGDLLNDGTHTVKLLIVEDEAHILATLEDVLQFDVHEDQTARTGGWHGKWIGAVRPRLEWTTELIAPGVPEHVS